LVKNDKVTAILDWDDAREDFIAQEISIFAAHTFLTEKKIKTKKMKLYFKEYEKHLKFNKEEKRAIYFFIKHRLLGAIMHGIKSAKKHKDMSKKIEKWTLKLIRRYRKFDKVLLEDFVKLL